MRVEERTLSHNPRMHTPDAGGRAIAHMALPNACTRPPKHMSSTAGIELHPPCSHMLQLLSISVAQRPGLTWKKSNGSSSGYCTRTHQSDISSSNTGLFDSVICLISSNRASMTRRIGLVSPCSMFRHCCNQGARDKTCIVSGSWRCCIRVTSGTCLNVHDTAAHSHFACMDAAWMCAVHAGMPCNWCPSFRSTHIEQRHLVCCILVVLCDTSIVVDLCAHDDHLVHEVDIVEVRHTCVQDRHIQQQHPIESICHPQTPCLPRLAICHPQTQHDER